MLRLISLPAIILERISGETISTPEKTAAG
jgi:hypothetical protein